MMEVIIRVNGEVVKYAYAQNVDPAKSDDEPSTYRIRPTNSLLCHSKKNGILSLAVMIVADLEDWERSVGKQCNFAKERLESFVEEIKKENKALLERHSSGSGSS